MKDTIDVSVRRSPKYSAFILVGVFLGMVAGGILASLPVDTSSLTREFTQASVVWMLMVFLGIIGGFLGAIVALIIDRVSIKRARVYQVDAEYREVRKPAAPATAPAETPAESADAVPAEAPAAAPAEVPAEVPAESADATPAAAPAEAPAESAASSDSREAELDTEEGPATASGTSRTVGE